MATLGWMTGCWLVSGLNADTSTLAGYSGALTWLVVCGFTYYLPELDTPQSAANLSWHERLGLDALTLLRHRDHRVVFITIALFSIPVAAFYPYTPPHLRDAGFHHTSAWMSLGQVLEVFAMFLLGGLMVKWRLKWILAAGLVFGVLRFAFCAMNQKLWLLAGVALHGCSFTFVFVTAQIYLDQRVDPAWRARAQALMSFVTVGVGNLTGYLSTGGWFALNTTADGMRWPVFWSGLSAAVAVVLFYFLTAYRGVGSGFRRTKDDDIGA
jgi:MFS family permease